jgi:hypothetical protein
MKSTATKHFIMAFSLLLGCLAASSLLAHASGNKNGHHRHPHVTQDTNGVVWQRQNYGQGFRQGRSVNGPYGNIIIWSPAPNQSRGMVSSPRGGVSVHNMPNQSAINAETLRKNQQIRNYGKTYKKDYGK